MKEIELIFRTSIQWGRLIKNLEAGEPDPKGIAYNAIIEEAKKEPDGFLVMNLHHLISQWNFFKKYGGWESKHGGVIRGEVCQDCFHALGDKLDNFQ